MSQFPVVELENIRQGDVWDGYHSPVTVDPGPPEVETDIDVTSDDWQVTIKQGEDVLLVMSTLNGYLTLSDVSHINYSIPATDTEQFPVGPVYGEVKNLTTNKTVMGYNTQVVATANPL